MHACCSQRRRSVAQPGAERVTRCRAAQSGRGTHAVVALVEGVDLACRGGRAEGRHSSSEPAWWVDWIVARRQAPGLSKPGPHRQAPADARPVAPGNEDIPPSLPASGCFQVSPPSAQPASASPFSGMRMLGWDSTNSPIRGSSVKPNTPLPVGQRGCGVKRGCGTERVCSLWARCQVAGRWPAMHASQPAPRGSGRLAWCRRGPAQATAQQDSATSAQRKGSRCAAGVWPGGKPLNASPHNSGHACNAPTVSTRTVEEE